MKREEILINSIWTQGKLNVYSDFFEQNVRMDLFTSEYTLEDTDQIISEQFVKAVNDFLNLPLDSQPLMKTLLYKHCLESCENTSYGFDVLNGETEMEANLREFGIKNEDDAYEKSNLDHVVIDESDQQENRLVRVIFYPIWDEEHGCELTIKDGILLDQYEESRSNSDLYDEDNFDDYAVEA